jgi:hypothetical protein
MEQARELARLSKVNADTRSRRAGSSGLANGVAHHGAPNGSAGTGV